MKGITSPIALVIGREYGERVKKKSFIIMTLLMPLLMLGLMIAPAAIMMLSSPSHTSVLVVDNSGRIASELQSDDDISFTDAVCTVDSALRRADIDAVLVIPRDVLANRKPAVKYFSNGPSAMSTESAIRSQINKIVETERLRSYDIENLDQIMAEVKCNIQLHTIRNDKEEQVSTSSEMSYGVSMALTFILYMFLLLYGQMVMNSIIEEKSSRVLEIVVSSVKPWQMMLGKITGVALVAVTQIVIWIMVLTVGVTFILPAVMPASAMADIAAVQAGNLEAVSSTESIATIQAFASLINVGYMLKIAAYLMLFLIGGFFFYSSIYAAVGSAVDNIQDASQLQQVVILPVLLGFVCSMVAATDPNTPLVFWLSLLPFTSPMVMMARVPFGIPDWEVWLSLVLLFASFMGMVWAAAKIYRVGIFMYGKKPTWRDLIRWISTD